jgi:hypothetical protein
MYARTSHHHEKKGIDSAAFNAAQDATDYRPPPTVYGVKPGHEIACAPANSGQQAHWRLRLLEREISLIACG